MEISKLYGVDFLHSVFPTGQNVIMDPFTKASPQLCPATWESSSQQSTGTVRLLQGLRLCTTAHVVVRRYRLARERHMCEGFPCLPFI